MGRPEVFSEQSYADALAEAKAQGRLLILDATAEWCGPCKAMDRTTWRDEKVVAWLKERAVAVQIDVDQEEALARSLKIMAMPTVIAFREGREFDRVVGAKGPGDLIAWLEGVLRGETEVSKLKRELGGKQASADERLELAKTLMASGSLDEATSEYAWLWEHIVELEPAMVGVRGSFMAAEMGHLARMHPPARARFATFRDALSPAVEAGQADEKALDDWIVLNEVLDEEDRTLAWFDRRKAGGEAGKLARIVEHRLIALLRERGRWADVGRLYPDPLAALREMHQRAEELKAAPFPEEMKEMREQMMAHAAQHFLQEAGQLRAALLAAGRDAEAAQVADEARRLAPGEALEQALREAEQAARAGPRNSGR